MFRLLELTKAVKPSMETQHVREEAHLPESVDVIDLERRMRGCVFQAIADGVSG